MLSPEPTITPEQIILEGINTFKARKLVMMSSGGKDSTTAAYITSSIAKKLGMEFEVLYLMTGMGIPQNFEFLLEMCNKNGWKLNVVEPLERFSYLSFLKRWGFPHGGMHNICMAFLKWYSLRRYAAEHKAEDVLFVSGRRLKESDRRASMKSNKYLDRVEPNIKTVSPIYYLETPQVWEYIKVNNLPLCPVYETLHISGDCLCGSFSEVGEAKLLNIFHKDLAADIKILEEQYGGVQQYREYQDKKKCPKCKKSKLKRGRNKWNDNETVYFYVCTNCKHRVLIQESDMEYTIKVKDFGHWGSGVSVTQASMDEMVREELLNIIPEDYTCNECFIDRKKVEMKQQS